MRILITGGGGMLARTLVRRWTMHEVHAPTRAELDITRPERIAAALAGFRPDAVVHTAAHTKVDLAESEPERAFALNAHGSAAVAIACHRAGTRLVAISTDYVFAGDAPRPYHEGDAPGPRTVYGASKLAGEQAVRTHCPDHLIARVAWLYGAGGPSFVHTMLRLGAQGGAPLRVVADQIGNPTSTDAVADALLHLIAIRAAGTFHLTCQDETSWCGFAEAIMAASGLGRAVIPCTTAEYPRPAPRPANSRLAPGALTAYGLPLLPDWRAALQQFLHDHPAG